MHLSSVGTAAPAAATNAGGRGGGDGRSPVVVIGASGNLGGAVAGSLTRAGVPVRVTGTDPAAVSRRFPAADAVRLDLHDPSTFTAALTGAAGLFLMRPPAIATVGPTLNALLDVAEKVGVGHVVFCSVTGADTNRVVPHHRVERHLQQLRVPWTILRPGFFAQNLADAYRDDIVHDDRIVLPAGRGKVAFVDVHDVGEVAASVLCSPGPHGGKAYTLTGPQALDFAQVAALLSAELGRPIRYQPTSGASYAAHVHRQGRAWGQAAVQTVLHTGLRHGQGETVDPTLPQLLGRPSRTLQQYVHDHRTLWGPA